MDFYSVDEVRRIFEREDIKWDGKVFDKSKIKFRPIKESDLEQSSLIIRMHPKSVAANDTVLTINDFNFTMSGSDINRDFTIDWCLILMRKNKEEYARKLLNYCNERKNYILKTYQERKKRGKKLYNFEVVEYQTCKELIEKANKYLDKEKV